MPRSRTAAAVVLLTLAATAAGQETVENPEFAAWNKFKPGTSLTVKVTTTAGGINTEVLMTNTLVQTGADKLVLETSATTKAGGNEFKQPAMKRDVPKTVTIPAGVKKEDLPAPGKKPPGTVEEGTETLKVAGAEYKTKWYRVKHSANGTEIEGKTWMSDDLPGMVAKSETTVKGPVSATTKMEVVDVKKGK
jgi:hypothetical protein